LDRTASSGYPETTALVAAGPYALCGGGARAPVPHFTGRVLVRIGILAALLAAMPFGAVSGQAVSHTIGEAPPSALVHEFFSSRAYLRNSDALNKRVNLRFPRPRPRSEVLASLTDLAGLRIVFDSDLHELRDLIQPTFEGLTVFQALQEAVRYSNLHLSLSPDGKLHVRMAAGEGDATNLDSESGTLRTEGSGTISGIVRDATDGSTLVGANVVIEGTPTGAATDLTGRFRIPGVPAGEQTLIVRYIGYETQRVEVVVVPDEVISLEIDLVFDVAQIEEVVVTSQVSGQAAAINQQLASNRIINVVSAERIQELPDANVAESIARLPGVSVERDAGEGQKVVIRGLAPQYNAVTINGIAAPATDAADRSVDLSMIAPEMLSAIEVTKALTPDQDADALGGSMNLSIREAPRGFRSTVSLQSGYASQGNELGIYKGSAVASNRVLGDRLGFIVTGSLERADRASDILDVSYYAQGNPAPGETFVRPRISDQQHQDNLEDRRRYGASAIVDFRSGNSHFKSTNFASRLHRDRLMRIASYTVAANWATYELRDIASSTDLLSNALQGIHHIGRLDVDWGLSRQRALSRTPESHRIRFRELGAFNAAIDSEGPDQLPTGANHNIANTFLYSGGMESSRVVESENAAYADLSLGFRAGRLAGVLKSGGKLRYKNRIRTSASSMNRLDNATWSASMTAAHPDLRLLSSGFLAMDNWVDPSFDSAEFLNGRFGHITMPAVVDEARMSAIYEEMQSTYLPTYSSTIRDYDADERVLAFYAMTELTLGGRVMLLPGFRYEHGHVSYKGYNGVEPPDGVDEGEIYQSLKDTTATHERAHLLPMVHLRVKGAPWFDVRLAYTETLSRPDYEMLSPRQVISHSSETVRYGTVELEPARARNYDAIVSFYGNRLGLLTAGVFHKRIRDFAYTREVNLVVGTEADPAVLGLPNSTRGYLMIAPSNNSFEARVSGVEFDWQTHLTYLPRPLNGLVLGLNYARMTSETSYPRTEIHRNDGDGPRLILVDTSFVAPLLLQPRHLFNASIGYDWRGFSARVSFNYQGSVRTNAGRRMEDVAEKEAFSRWDLMVSQRLSPALSVFFNMNNISNQPDESTNIVSTFPTAIEYYGYTFNIGLRGRL